MKKIMILFSISISSIINPHCEIAECIANMTVASLELVPAASTGNVLTIACVIKNVISTSASCTESGESIVTVFRGYSSSDQDSFSDYEPIAEPEITTSANLESGEYQEDIMRMATSRGPGFYAMKVLVESEYDDDSSNNADAIRIKVD